MSPENKGPSPVGIQRKPLWGNFYNTEGVGSLHKIKNVVSHELTLRKSPKLPCGLTNNKRKAEATSVQAGSRLSTSWQTQLVCTRGPSRPGLWRHLGPRSSSWEGEGRGEGSGRLNSYPKGPSYTKEGSFNYWVGQSFRLNWTKCSSPLL